MKLSMDPATRFVAKYNSWKSSWITFRGSTLPSTQNIYLVCLTAFTNLLYGQQTASSQRLCLRNLGA